MIPALNEADSIGLVLDAIPEGLVRRVVVGDNGSTDGTADVVRRHGGEVVAAPRRGYGSACLAALGALRADPPDVVVFLDGDYSDHPEDLPDVLAPIRAGAADFVIGSRTAGRAEAGALLPQARFGNALACFLMRLLYGHRYTDLGPFRAITWSALERVGMRDPNFGWTVELQVKGLRIGLRPAEVPVRYRKRIGVSKVTGTVKGTIGAGVKILWTIFLYTVKPVRPGLPPYDG